MFKSKGKQALERLDFINAVRKNDNLLEYPEGYTVEDLENLDWAKFKIIVPNETEAHKVRMALKYLHDSDIDTNFVWVNQIVHCYEKDHPCLIVDNK